MAGEGKAGLGRPPAMRGGEPAMLRGDRSRNGVSSESKEKKNYEDKKRWREEVEHCAFPFTKARMRGIKAS